MPFSEPARSFLTEEERKRARAVVVKKSLRYFEDTNNRSLSEDCLFTRRRNLASHLGVDETISKKELGMINVHALPLPASVQKSKTTPKCFTKMDSVDSAVQCEGENGLNDTGFSEEVKISQPCYKSTSCSSTSTQTNRQTIVDDDYDTSTSSSVDTCRESNCQHYTCCEIESCEEEVFAVTQCTKEATGRSKDIIEEPEVEYKGKDLTNYLGMLDCVSSSIADHKVSITSPVLSRSAQTSFSMKNLAVLGKTPTVANLFGKRRTKHLSASDRSVSLSRITALKNMHASHKRKPTHFSFKN